MTGASGPFWRDSISFRDTMQRHFSTIENALYAAEQACHQNKDNRGCVPKGCPFVNVEIPFKFCDLKEIRKRMGEHVIQHDAMPGVSPVPPCQCGGDCGCRRHGE